MTLVAPLQIYVDESGSPDFYEIKDGQPLKAYVPCAIAVPTMEIQALLRILPRGTNGKFLKSSDLGFSEAVAIDFITHLLRSNVEIAAILIDPAHSTSVAAAQNNTALVNRRRQEVHHPKITEAGFTYSLFAAQLVTNILISALHRTGRRPTFFDVILDRPPLKVAHERHWRASLKSAADSYETTIDRIEWTDEEHEPLLLLPDLVAGVLHRDAVNGDMQHARQLLQNAGKVGRISLQDGHKIKLK